MEEHPVKIAMYVPVSKSPTILVGTLTSLNKEVGDVKFGSL